jgi:hypothetical protein
MSELYGKWEKAFEQAAEDPGSVARLTCPSCGCTALRLLFVVPEWDSTVGWSEFWSENCRQGIFFSRVSVPPRGNSITINERTAVSEGEGARYTIIPPPDYPDDLDDSGDG